MKIPKYFKIGSQICKYEDNLLTKIKFTKDTYNQLEFLKINEIINNKLGAVSVTKTVMYDNDFQYLNVEDFESIPEDTFIKMKNIAIEFLKKDL